MRFLLGLVAVILLIVIALMAVGRLTVGFPQGSIVPVFRLDLSLNKPVMQSEPVGIGTTNVTVQRPTVEMRNTTVSLPTIEVNPASTPTPGAAR